MSPPSIKSLIERMDELEVFPNSLGFYGLGQVGVAVKGPDGVIHVDPYLTCNYALPAISLLTDPTLLGETSPQYLGSAGLLMSILWHQAFANWPSLAIDRHLLLTVGRDSNEEADVMLT